MINAINATLPDANTTDVGILSPTSTALIDGIGCRVFCWHPPLLQEQVWREKWVSTPAQPLP